MAVQQIRQGKRYFPKSPKDKIIGGDTLSASLFNRIVSLSIC
jgi:hypothetical protein